MTSRRCSNCCRMFGNSSAPTGCGSATRCCGGTRAAAGRGGCAGAPVSAAPGGSARPSLPAGPSGCACSCGQGPVSCRRGRSRRARRCLADDFPCFSVREIPWGDHCFRRQGTGCSGRPTRRSRNVSTRCPPSSSNSICASWSASGHGTRRAPRSPRPRAGLKTNSRRRDVTRIRGNHRARQPEPQRDRRSCAGPPPRPRDVVIVTALISTRSISSAVPPAAAPGADDNGSGSAGVLAIARAMQHHRGELDRGSFCSAGRRRGCSAAWPTSRLCRCGAVAGTRGGQHGHDRHREHTRALPSCWREPRCRSNVIERLADAAHTYTGLTVQTSLNPFNSDHVPFIDAGIPAVLTIEGLRTARTIMFTALTTPCSSSTSVWRSRSCV